MNKTDFHNISEKDRLNRTLEGIAFYASVHSPNMTSVKKFNGEPYFIVNLGLDEENQKLALAYGLEVLPAEGKITMPYVKIKRKVNTAKGKTAEGTKPTVIDTNQNPVPSNILIGNGSKVRVKFTTYWHDNNGGGVSTALMKVQIVDLIPFKPSDKAFVSDGSGFQVSGQDTAAAAEAEDEFADELPWEETKVPVKTKKVSGSKAAIFDK